MYYTNKKIDIRGRVLVNVQLLVLCDLRYIATRCAFDALDELTHVAGETHRIFACDIFLNWGKHTAKENTNLPDLEEKIQYVTGLYEISGHSGCIGSVDCVHIV